MDVEPRPDEFLAPLLHTLAESLDVREIFARISVAANGPHRPRVDPSQVPGGVNTP